MSFIAIVVDPDRDPGRCDCVSSAIVPGLAAFGHGHARSPEMKNGLFAFVLLIGIGSSPPSRADMPEKTLDTSGITAVAISGNASSIHLTTSEGSAYRALMDSRRSGWFSGWYSSWFFSDCRKGGEMRVEGSTLFIEVAPSSWADLSDCTVEISANVPRGSSISIDQAALMARLDGDFSSVAIDSKAGDVALEGHATSVAVKGEAIKASVVFDRVEKNETIALDAKALDAFLKIGQNDPISYSVAAAASFVDSALANIPGSKPAISIKGNYVRATIR